MTDTDTATDLVAVHPTTGEAIVKDATTTDLADAFEAALELRGRLDEFAQAIVGEVADRMDKAAERKALLPTAGDGLVELEVNAPTSEEYPVDIMRTALETLVADGVLDDAVLAKVITTPPPKPQDPKVDKREVNKLKKSSDRRVLAAIAGARTVVTNRRTLKIKRKDGTA